LVLNEKEGHDLIFRDNGFVGGRLWLLRKHAVVSTQTTTTRTVQTSFFINNAHV